MDKQEAEKCASAEDGSHLNRNRSFKSKQLVRSQAIRESTSPPRTVSPSVCNDACGDAPKNVNKVNVKVSVVERTGSDSSHDSDALNYSDRMDRRKPVEIQITQGSWDEGPPHEHRGRTKRWLSDSSRDCTRDLLSNNPRVACVCGACAACPQCRGRRRRHICNIKQDSGIYPDECSECSDPEPNGVNNNNRKTRSLDVDEQYYCRCPERRDKPKSTLTRTDSDDKSEPTGPELVAFLKDTLNKSGRDRMTLIKIEKELHSLVNDTGRCIVKFPVMTSYGRMLVHRCAALFQLSHHLDQSNKNCVIVSKIGTSGGRIPCTNFRAWCVVNFPPPSPQRHPPETIDGANAKSILKRDSHSLDEPLSAALAISRSKSLEQREKEYERVRRRIFSTDNCNREESQWPWISTGPVKLLAPEPGRNKLLKVQSLENSAPPQNWRGRGGQVSKSHSFGGYSEPQPPSRALSRQGNLASSSWRLSPSSSGYKTLSLRSTDSVTPSPTGGGTPEPANGTAPFLAVTECAPVVWAVTDMSCVPPGAVVLHPQTGRPLTNTDGSVYYFDPVNPPILYDPVEYEEVPQPQMNKRRGRLQKQHSFIDHEAEYHQTNQYQYEYQLHEPPDNPAEKEKSKPMTPAKVRYGAPVQNEFNQQPEPTNQMSEVQDTANQSAFEPRTFANREPKAGTYQDTVYYGPYASLNQGYSEEAQSPPQMAYIQQDLNMQNMMSQAKVAPMLQDHNIRAISMANVYPASVPAYQYVPNPSACRADPLQQQLVGYQPMLQQQMEEQKVPTPPQAPDNTFRIDPSYPYAPVDYAGQPQTSYSVPYNPADITGMAGAMPPVYPLSNVIQPQLIQYPVQYQDAVQWTPVQTQPMCPVLYPQQYAHYNVVYPQVMPQAYPVCQPIYPVLDNRRKRNSLPSSTRVTPIITTPEEKPYEKFDRQNSEIAAKINQIKEGMLQREGIMNRRRDDWKRNSGNGILGSYPINTYGARIPGATDNAQMASAARAIVNSLRHSYHQERRYDYNSYHKNYDRPDNRRRYEYRGDVNSKGDGNNVDRNNYKDASQVDSQGKSNAEDKINNSDLNRLTQDIQDRTSNNSDKNTIIPNINNNSSGRNSSASFKSCQDRNISEDSNGYQASGSSPDKSNVQASSTLPDKTYVQASGSSPDKSYVQASSSLPDKSNVQANSTWPDKSNVQASSTLPDKSYVQASSSLLDKSYMQASSSLPDKSNVQASGTWPGKSYVQASSSLPDKTYVQASRSSPGKSYVQASSSLPDKSFVQASSSLPDKSYVQASRSSPDKSYVQASSSLPDKSYVQASSSLPDKSYIQASRSLPEKSNVQEDSYAQDISSNTIGDQTAQHIQNNALEMQTNEEGTIQVQDRTAQNIVQGKSIQSVVKDRAVPGDAQERTHERSAYYDRHSGQDARNYQETRNYNETRYYHDNRNHHETRSYHETRTYQDARNYQDTRNYHDRSNYQGDRSWHERKYAPRIPGIAPGQYHYRPPYVVRQMAPANWCRRSPAPVHPGINQPRRPFLDTRYNRR